jgi:hypothetical protein
MNERFVRTMGESVSDRDVKCVPSNMFVGV